MDLQQIKQILDLVREHELSEFEIEHDGLRLKVRKDANGSHAVAMPATGADAGRDRAAAGAIARGRGGRRRRAAVAGAGGRRRRRPRSSWRS